MLSPNTEVGRYRIERVLGVGGFGVTYLAVCLASGARVAIKEFLPCHALRDDSTTVRVESSDMLSEFRAGLGRFRKEAAILAAVDHPNMPRFVAWFEANGTGNLVMSYEQGRDLAHVMRSCDFLCPEEVRKIVSDIARGLRALHAQDVLHRDIKPANIVRRHDGSYALVDFGSARHRVAGDNVMTSLVTRHFSPLEQFGDRARDQGAWSDIYSLAATALSLLTGDEPPSAEARSIALLNGGEDPLSGALTTALARAPHEFVNLLVSGLGLRIRDRPSSVCAWLDGTKGHSVGVRVKATVEDNVPMAVLLARGRGGWKRV